VTISNADGDEPAVAMNLIRYTQMLGYRPVLAGNMKGMLDVRRNPDTQREFARRLGQEPAMIVSFADGTKLALESAVLANATGLAVERRGMRGIRCEHVNEVTKHLDADELLAQPRVDYVVGAQPANGAFVVVHCDDPAKRDYLRYYKMGDGPLYVFYTPFHLPTFEVAATIARVALERDAAITPQGLPVGDVVAVAKRDLAAGETLDGIGGFMCYGQLEDATKRLAANQLPMGVAIGCRLRRSVQQDDVLTYDDVELPAGRLCDALRAEQDAWLAEGWVRSTQYSVLGTQHVQQHTAIH
jgi:predicted homoserine dehydrogenase-like protein